MKKSKFIAGASLVLLAATATPSFAEFFPPTHFRCAADQLFGWPSMPDPQGRTGYGRRLWAQKGYGTYAGNGNQANGERYWLPVMFNPDVNAQLAAGFDLYPLYLNGDGSVWVGPGPNNPTWNGTTASGIANIPVTGMYNLPTGVNVGILCEAGCYSPEQQIRVGESLISVAKAHESGEITLVTLAPDSTIDSLEFMKNRIARWTVDVAPAEQAILTLRMKSGGELRVTTEHPLLTSEGVMKPASALILGESLVLETGAPDPVVSIAKTSEFTKTYNLRPTTTDLASNILVAQGYLTGSARYQNEFLKYLNRALFRHKIPAELIARAAR